MVHAMNCITFIYRITSHPVIYLITSSLQFIYRITSSLHLSHPFIYLSQHSFVYLITLHPLINRTTSHPFIYRITSHPFIYLITADPFIYLITSHPVIYLIISSLQFIYRITSSLHLSHDYASLHLSHHLILSFISIDSVRFLTSAGANINAEDKLGIDWCSPHCSVACSDYMHPTAVRN